MTLYELVNSITIQGNVRLSIFEDDSEKSTDYKGTYDLSDEDIEEFEDMMVTYMFYGDDGFMHIELEKSEE